MTVWTFGSMAAGFANRSAGSARPAVEMVRGNQTQPFQAVPTPEARDTINALMQQKYGFADRYLSCYFPRSRKVPLHLASASPAP